jgi:hypothetical protein
MHHDAMTLKCGVRATIDLPDELHEQAQVTLGGGLAHLHSDVAVLVSA